jgi:hypothetical protein
MQDIPLRPLSTCKLLGKNTLEWPKKDKLMKESLAIVVCLYVVKMHISGQGGGAGEGLIHAVSKQKKIIQYNATMEPAISVLLSTGQLEASLHETTSTQGGSGEHLRGLHRSKQNF